MDGFAKLSNNLVTSSLWSEDDKTRIMFITMLALADAQGYVSGTIPGLSDLARMSLSEGEAAIQKLLSPDKYSRSPEGEGRRIILTDGGFLLTGYARHRVKRDPEKRREQNKEAQARFRAKQDDSKPIVSQSKPKSAQAEDRRQSAEAEACLKDSDKGAETDSSKRVVFANWMQLREKITDEFPRNKTVVGMLGILGELMRIQRYTEEEISLGLADIVRDSRGKNIKNPPAFFICRCQEKFRIPRKGR